MRVARFWVPGQGARLGLCEGDTLRELASPDAPALESFEALVQLARRTRRDLRRCVQDLSGSASGSGSAYSYQDLDRAPNPGVPHLLLPVVPPEVWAAGVTYERSREARLAETTTVGIYDKVYDAERPEVFFKATPSRCVGPNAPVGIRADSRWTVPEPELGVVLGGEGEVLGYTLGNDMSARDIEGENPLYLPQTKIYRACCMTPWRRCMGRRARPRRSGTTGWPEPLSAISPESTTGSERRRRQTPRWSARHRSLRRRGTATMPRPRSPTRFAATSRPGRREGAPAGIQPVRTPAPRDSSGSRFRPPRSRSRPPLRTRTRRVERSPYR